MTWFNQNFRVIPTGNIHHNNKLIEVVVSSLNCYAYFPDKFLKVESFKILLQAIALDMVTWN